MKFLSELYHRARIGTVSPQGAPLGNFRVNERRRREGEKIYNGGQEREVGERVFGPTVTLAFDVEAYPDPKALMPAELERLKTSLKTNRRVADYLGVSKGMVRDRLAVEPAGRKEVQISSKAISHPRSKRR